jgi:hypothetical protein
MVFTARYAMSLYITQICFILRGLNVDKHNYELVNSFAYLGSCTKNDNNKLSKILPNKAHCSLTTIMKSHMVHKFVIIRLHKTLICTVLVYKEDLLNSCTRKKQALEMVTENEMWRIRFNEELHR